MNKVAALTVIYPSAETYFNDFISSVKKQSWKNFDLIIVNDGVSDTIVKSFFSDIPHHIIDKTGTPAYNREVGIKYAITQQYDFLILCDIDDVFQTNRFSKIINEFCHSETDIIVHDLNVVDENLAIVTQDYFSHSLPRIRTSIDKSFIRDKNIFGLSNTAIRISSLTPTIEFSDIQIVDWYFYALLLESNLRATYIPESLTNYRQHTNNAIGLNNLSIELFRKLSKLKIEHYNALQQKFSIYNSYYANSLNLLSLKDEEIKKIITNKKEYPLWWEMITTI
jgi:glycosyltransferase involved in cell wall biosynthesis